MTLATALFACKAYLLLSAIATALVLQAGMNIADQRSAG